jgi:hypothetical protein
VTVWLEQLDALAVNVNGEETVLPLYGLVTVGLARAGTATRTGSREARESSSRSFIRTFWKFK